LPFSAVEASTQGCLVTADDGDDEQADQGDAGPAEPPSGGVPPIDVTEWLRQAGFRGGGDEPAEGGEGAPDDEPVVYEIDASAGLPRYGAVDPSRTRHQIAMRLVYLLGIVVLLPMLLVAAGRLNLDEMKTVYGVIVPPVATLAGAAVAFFFKS
jgi:hypothetical protein